MTPDKRTTGTRLAYTTDQVAELLGISVRTVRDHMQSGEIPCFVMGQRRMVRHDTLVAWMATREQQHERVTRARRRNLRQIA
jgi:excisionase family DNA binding protein